MSESDDIFKKLVVSNKADVGIRFLFLSLLKDIRTAIEALPSWEKVIHIFWLFGPFILLIERSPADIWLSILALTFVVRALIKRDGDFLKHFWVKAAFVFWFWCLLTAGLSDLPMYSLGEAFVWFRFPLFAMCVCFWLARDRRLLYAMLLSTMLGLTVMSGILTAEILIEGQKGGRLTWPYGDLVPGNYVAKVGLPVFTISVALAVAIKGRLGMLSGLFAFVTMIVSLMTGERINFLIRACGGMLAGLVWKPRWSLYLGLILVELLAVLAVFSALPATASRYTDKLINGATNIEGSPWLRALNGGFQIAKENLLLGIGPGNYRYLSRDLLANIPFSKPDNHPHNFYIQLLSETGLIGFILGLVFFWSMIWACFRASFKMRDNVFVVTAWVVPLGLFWPIATTADFFGQWNNIFMWSALSIAMVSTMTKQENVRG